MCLGVPMKIVKILDDKHALAEALGVQREINIMAVPDVKEGQYVMVHAGMAISIVRQEEAQEALQIWQELMEVWKS
jgi:hydrogenase expression/formation protein HypC